MDPICSPLIEPQHLPSVLPGKTFWESSWQDTSLTWRSWHRREYQACLCGSRCQENLPSFSNVMWRRTTTNQEASATDQVLTQERQAMRREERAPTPVDTINTYRGKCKLHLQQLQPILLLQTWSVYPQLVLHHHHWLIFSAYSISFWDKYQQIYMGKDIPGLRFHCTSKVWQMDQPLACCYANLDMFQRPAKFLPQQILSKSTWTYVQVCFTDQYPPAPWILGNLTSPTPLRGSFFREIKGWGSVSNTPRFVRGLLSFRVRPSHVFLHVTFFLDVWILLELTFWWVGVCSLLTLTLNSFTDPWAYMLRMTRVHHCKDSSTPLTVKIF